MVNVELRAAADVGRCAVSGCAINQVLLIVAGDQEMRLCERHFQAVLAAAGLGDDVAMEREAILNDKIAELENENEEVAMERNAAEHAVCRLQREISQLEKK